MRTIDDLTIDELREWIADLNLWADTVTFSAFRDRSAAWDEIAGDGDYELRKELLDAYAAKVQP